MSIPIQVQTQMRNKTWKFKKTISDLLLINNMLEIYV